MLRIQECTRQWWTDSEGVRQYSSWQCVTIYDDGGGTGNGSSVPVDDKSQKPTEGQCDGIRELLKREAEHGTRKAASMSSIEFGGKTRLMSLQNEINGLLWVKGNPLDIDWLLDLNAVNPTAGNLVYGNMIPIVAYTGGKTVWSITKLITGQSLQNPIPFTEAAERNAVSLSGLAFSKIFDKKWLEKNCNYTREAAGKK